MNDTLPKALIIIAGKGVYPLLLAESAREQGVERIVAVAFRGETDPRIKTRTDETVWIRMGQLGHMLKAMKATGIPHAVMAGQITPTNLFRVRFDAKTLEILKRLKVRNAETLFSAVADELNAIGVALQPASRFMENHMPEPGLLTRRAPTERDWQDIRLGLKVAATPSGLDIGQTVVIKEGTILAVEAFEGTNDAIRRARKLGGPGIVIVKVAKDGHDMRFDIPVVGGHTLKLLKKVKASVLAVQAGRCILLEKQRLIEAANAMNLSLLALNENGEIS
jgi:DUF1009 family protein